MSCGRHYKTKYFKNMEALRAVIKRELIIEAKTGLPLKEQTLKESDILRDNKTFLARNLFMEALKKISEGYKIGSTEKLSTKDIDKILVQVFEEKIASRIDSFGENADDLISMRDEILGLNDFYDELGSARDFVLTYLGLQKNVNKKYVDENGETVLINEEDIFSEEAPSVEETPVDEEDMSKEEEETNGSTGDHTSEQKKNFDASAQHIDMRASLSRAAKMLFAGIKNTGEKRMSPHEEFFGLEDYIDPKKVLISLQELLTEGITDMQTLKERIETKIVESTGETDPALQTSGTYLFLREVYERLEQQPLIVQNTILSKLNAKRNRMEYLHVTFKGAGRISRAQIYNANSRNKDIHLRKRFETNFKVSKLINLEEGNTFSVNVKEAEDWLEEMEDIKVMLNSYKNSSVNSLEPILDGDIKKIQRTLAKVGLDLNSQTIKDLYYGRNLHSTDDKTLSEKFSDAGGGQVFSTIMKNVAAAVKAQKDSNEKITFPLDIHKAEQRSFNENSTGHFLFYENNNFLKNLIYIESKHTLTPESTLYLDGKNIYEYIPTNATETILSKIQKNIQEYWGKEATAKDIKGYVGQLLSLPAVSNNFFLRNFLESKLALEEFDVKTISPESFKLQVGSKYEKLDKAKISDLGPKDRALVEFGFFADMGRDLTSAGALVAGKRGTEAGKIKTRMSRMFFSALSDASDLFFANAPVLNITTDSGLITTVKGAKVQKVISIDGEVTEHVREQLVDGEMKRIISYMLAGKRNPNFKLNSNQNLHSQLLLNLPGLNLVEVEVEGGEKVLLLDKIHAIINQGFEEKNDIDSDPNNQISAELSSIIHDQKERDLVSNPDTISTEEYIFAKIEQELGEDINSFVTEFINAKKDALLKIDSNTGDISGDWVDHGFVTGKNSSTMKAPLIDPKFLASKGEGSLGIDAAAYDFVVNQLVSQANLQQLFSGDLTNYGKTPKAFNPSKHKGLIDFFDVSTEKSQGKSSRKEIMSDIINEISKSVDEDRSKRLKANLSPGTKNANPNGQNLDPEYLQLYLQDEEYASEQIDEIFQQHYSKEDYTGAKDLLQQLKDAQKGLKEELEKEVPSEDNLEQYREANKTLTKQLSSAFPKIGPFLEITNTDGQEYTTWREHLKTLLDRGAVGGVEFDPSEVKEIYKKLQDYEAGYSSVVEFTEREKQIIFQPMKPLHAGHYVEDVDGYKNSVFVYIKSSSFPLIPGMTKSFKLDNLRKKLEQLERETQKPVRAGYVSANKLGARIEAVNTNFLTKDSNDLTPEQIASVMKGTRVLSRDNFYIQQDKPFKADKNLENNQPNLVTRSVQLARSLLSNGINRIEDKIFPVRALAKDLKQFQNLFDISPDGKGNISGEQLALLYDKLYQEEQSLKREELYNDFKIEFGEWNQSVETMEAVQKMLIREAKSPQVAKTLELVYSARDENGDLVEYSKKQISDLGLTPEAAMFRVPLWLNTMALPMETSLNAKITNALARLKLPGWSSPVGSSNLFTKKSGTALTSAEKDGVVYTKGFDPSKGLQYITEVVQDENGNKVKKVRSQVLVSSKFEYNKRIAQSDGTYKYKKVYADLTSDEFSTLDPVTGIRTLDESKFDPDLLSAMSFRIPFSDHGSGVAIEIVGFLPHNTGDLMVVPQEHTTQLGEDYDIDIRTVYGYHHETVYDKDGKPTIKKLTHRSPESFNTKGDKKILNEYYDLKKEVNKEIYKTEKKYDKIYKENILEIFSLRKRKEVLKKLRKSGEATEEELTELLSVQERLSVIDSKLYKEGITADKQAVQEQLNELLADIEAEYGEKLANIENNVRAYRKYQEHRKKVIENNLVDVHKMVYENPDPRIRKVITKALSTDLVSDTVKMMEAKKQEVGPITDKTVEDPSKKYFTVYDSLHQREVMDSGNSGKLGIGIHSLWVTFNALSQQLDMIPGKDYTVEINMGFHPEEENKISFGGLTGEAGLGRIDSLKNEDGDNATTKISDGNMINQNTSMDNQKLLLMAKRNENKYTINVLALLTNMGWITNNFDVDNGEISSGDVASLLISQPIIRRFVELKTASDSLTGEYQSDKDIYEQLFEELQALNPDIDISQYSSGKIDYGDEGVYNTPMNFKNLTPNVILTQAASELPDSDPKMQAQMLYMFKTLQSKSEEVSKHQGILKLASNGTEKSYTKTIEAKSSLLNTGLQNLYDTRDVDSNVDNSGFIEYPSSLKGIENVYGDFQYLFPESADMLNIGDKDAFLELKREAKRQGGILLNSYQDGKPLVVLIPNKFVSHQMVSVIEAEETIMGNITVFENRTLRNTLWSIAQNTALYARKRLGQEMFSEHSLFSGKGLEITYNFFSGLRNYFGTVNMGTSNMFGGESVEYHRKRLLYKTEDSPSLAGYIVQLRAIANDPEHPEYSKMNALFNNLFFDRLDPIINSKDESDIIKLEARAGDDVDKKAIYLSLLDMSESEQTLPLPFKGDDNYTYKKLVEDFARYTLIAGNSKGAAGMNDSIPAEIFDKLGHYKTMRNFDNMFKGEGTENMFDNFMNFSSQGHLRTIYSLLGNHNYKEIIERKKVIDVSYIEPEVLQKIKNAVNKLNNSYGAEVISFSENNKIGLNPAISGVFSEDIIKDQFLRHNPEIIQSLGNDINKFLNKNSGDVLEMEFYDQKETFLDDSDPFSEPKEIMYDIDHEFQNISRITLTPDFISKHESPTIGKDKMSGKLDYFTIGDAIFRRIFGTENQYERVSKLGATGSHEYSFINGQTESLNAVNTSWKKGDLYKLSGENIGRAREMLATNSLSFRRVDQTKGVNLEKVFTEGSGPLTEKIRNLLQYDPVSAILFDELRRHNVFDYKTPIEFVEDVGDNAANARMLRAGEAHPVTGEVAPFPKILLRKATFNDENIPNARKAEILSEELFHRVSTEIINDFTSSTIDEATGNTIINFKFPENTPDAIKDLKNAFEDTQRHLKNKLYLEIKANLRVSGLSGEALTTEAKKQAEEIFRGIMMNYRNKPGFENYAVPDYLVPIQNLLYRVGNMDEFMAGIVSHKEFREEMGRTEFTKKPFIERIADIISSLFSHIVKIKNPDNPSISEVSLNAIHDLLTRDSFRVKRMGPERISSQTTATTTTSKAQQVFDAIDKFAQERQLELNEDESQYIDPNDNNLVWERASGFRSTNTFEENEDSSRHLTRGNIADKVLREFIGTPGMTVAQFSEALLRIQEQENALAESKGKKGSYQYTDTAIRDLYTIYKKFQQQFSDYEIRADIPTMWGVLDGVPYAGTVDMLAVHKETGKVIIIDLKNSVRDRYNDAQYGESYKDSDKKQQSAYAELFQQRTGIKVDEVKIFPVRAIEKKGKITTFVPREIGSTVSDYTDAVEIDPTIRPDRDSNPLFNKNISDHRMHDVEAILNRIRGERDYSMRDIKGLTNQFLARLVGDSVDTGMSKIMSRIKKKC